LQDASGTRLADTLTSMPHVLEPREACAFLVAHLGLRRVTLPPGARGARALLKQLRCIQLDPLDPMGTNADLVALARLDGVKRGDLYRFVYPGHAFEHFAKERCLLPPAAFPYYRDFCAETRWWRHGERLERVPVEIVAAVLEELRERGPLSAAELADHGSVDPIDWHGWKSTAKAASMAVDVLWTRCQVVVCGRGPRGRVYDVPERALPKYATIKSSPNPATDGEAKQLFARWALLERVEAAGLLARAGGASWSMLWEARTSGLVDELVAAGELEEVLLKGSTRRYLAPKGFRDRRFPESDGRLRILGPLDPLVWDRDLVRHAFGFDYVWEVYKPAAQRRWGWYVCPLLHGDALVGRIDAAMDGDVLRVKRIWSEGALDREALRTALERHAAACGAKDLALPRLR
jgi:uncharacterized protein YcaQ